MFISVPEHGFSVDIASGGGVAGECDVPLGTELDHRQVGRGETLSHLSVLMLATLALPFVPTPRGDKRLAEGQELEHRKCAVSHGPVYRAFFASLTFHQSCQKRVGCDCPTAKPLLLF